MSESVPALVMQHRLSDWAGDAENTPSVALGPRRIS